MTVAAHVGRRISIHALLAESDGLPCFADFRYRYFYPRSPCGERRYTVVGCVNHAKFLSTLSLRRATRQRRPRRGKQRYFYPRSPCGERPKYHRILPQRNAFLSTLSLRRATPCPPAPPRQEFYFYPRSPCGERQQHFENLPK